MVSDEEKWIQLLCKGDEAAYAYFFEEYYSLLGVFAMKYVKEKETAEDIVHDAILELYNRKLKFTNVRALKSYLYLSIRNRCLNHFRHNLVRKNYLNEHAGWEKEDFFLNNIIEEEIYLILQKTIHTLPTRISDIYDLSLQGCSNEEIAEKLSLSIDSVKSYKKRGKQILRKKLKGLVPLWILYFI